MATAFVEQSSAIKHVKSLHQINVDSAVGFKEVADNCDSPELADLFRNYEAQRRQQATELAGYLSPEDREQTDDDRSAAATAHQWWINLRDSVSGNDDLVTLEEAERGEDAILDKYRDAVGDDETMRSPAADAVRQQHDAVKAAHDSIRAMRDRLKAAR
jgi:uncharacterized protein (TIGR02284 family)